MGVFPPKLKPLWGDFIYRGPLFKKFLGPSLKKVFGGENFSLGGPQKDLLGVFDNRPLRRALLKINYLWGDTSP